VSPICAAASQEEASHALQAGEKQLAELSAQLDASEKARANAEAQVVALKGKVDELQLLVDEAKSDGGKAEQSRQQLLSGARIAAGQLKTVKQEFSALKDSASAMREELVQAMQQMEEGVVAQVSATVQDMEEEKSAALVSLKSEQTERRRLHNLVLDLKGNIRVFCRARPPSQADKNALTFASDTEMVCDVAGKSHPFSYDCVFGPKSQQAAVFAETQPLVVSVLDGYHACILAYGQTGSGKTHTMQGYGAEPGVNTRAINELFDIAKERAVSHAYTIKVTLIEIYNESLRDLLEPRDESGKEKSLDVKIAASADASGGAGAYNGGTHVPGVMVAEVSSMEQVFELLKKGELNRTVAGTDMNERSSRSHMVLSVFVEGCNLATGGKTFGKLHLIDLAGSERLARSGAQGQQLKEAQNINKSLSALGDCIQSLVAKSKHVPFRNSKLTFFLQDSLSGDSKVLMIVCVSCDEDNSGETLCSLNFAARARNVTLGPAKCKATGASEAKLRERERDLDAAREALRKMEAAVQDMNARFEDADASHDKARAALEKQVEELQSESRAQLKKMEQQKLVSDQLRAQLQAARSSAAGADAGEGLADVAEEEDAVEEEAEIEQAVGKKAGSGSGGEGHKGTGDVAKDVSVGRWAHPTISTLAAKGEVVASPRGARKMNKSLLLGNKENNDVSSAGGALSSPRVRRPELGTPSTSQNKSAAPACASKPLDKTDKAGSINDRLESRLASMRTSKLRDGISSLPGTDKASADAPSSSSTSAIKGVPARKEGRYIAAGVCACVFVYLHVVHTPAFTSTFT